MKLPNSDRVIIERKKLLNYIISETHPLGKFKAKIFRSFGFNDSNVFLLESELREIVQLIDIKQKIESLYGIKYIIVGKINTPSKRTIKVITVWIMEESQDRPRFVTIYPV